MPMYAYACKDCGHTFDIQQSFSDDSLTVCPVCDGALRKKFNSVGVVFKGSGFYRNDSRATTSSTDAKSTTASSSPASSETSGAGASKGTSASTSVAPAASGADRAAS
ncbi:FmdB family transcriptional regulator [Arthrobacter pityocampae]|uniref:FmdB family transcriptional regulator n=1 Tax=Arthrobacter pityocampae TaxID=547334 RepID=A0A2S5J2F6_9MICC|nr:FmdB family zinc ribbon protein [Arthrobacter pityocampae]PPB50930.1 FmdB family transcriptional regulator [Arthrobacter pityocampae]